MSESDRPDEQVIDGDPDLDAILLALDTAGRELPVEAIREARRCRNAMIPKLIQALQTASAAARSGARPEGQAHFFALFLLTEFQAKEALPAIVEAVSLPGELPFDLFGDSITETLARVLASLAGDRHEVLDQLIQNRDLNEYVRWVGAQAYPLLVRDGQLSRLEAVQQLQRHLREAIQNDDLAIAAPLVSELVCLAPKEAYEDIVEAYRRNLVDTFQIRLADVDKSVAEGEAGFLRWQSHCEPTGIADTIAELETWAAFRQEPPPRTPTLASRPRLAPPSGSLSPPPELPTHRIGRNELCPCGSGKKFKKCCGSRRI